jgi:hypothetical protein
LRELVPFRQIRIEIVLAIEFGIVGQVPPERDPDPQDRLYRLLVDDICSHWAATR